MRKSRLWLLVTILSFVLLFFFGLYTAVTSRSVHTDDVWFLQVVNRMLNREVLYRDIYSGITPLSMYFTVALASLLGAEYVVLKVVMALCFSATCLLTYFTSRQLDIKPLDALLLVLLLLAYFPLDLRYGVPYTLVAYMFLLATFSATLAWRNLPQKSILDTGHGREWILLGIAGACAGLSFASKQNVGVFTFGALAIAVVVAHSETKGSVSQFVRMFGIATGSFVLSMGLVLLPVLLSGSLGKFLEYGFLKQGKFLALPHTGYLQYLEMILDKPFPMTSVQNVLDFYWGLLYLLPFITFGALIYLLLFGERRHRNLTVIVIVFVLAAVAGVYPTASVSHLMNTFPTLLVGLAFALRHIRFYVHERWARAMRVGLGVWVAVGILALVIFPVRWITSGVYVFSDLPHLRGVLVHSSFLEEAESYASKVVRVSGEKPMFLFSQHASLIYLITGLENPTPFDLPVIPAFGLNGESEVIEAIERGDIGYVCMQPLGNHPRKPLQLENYVLDNMDKVRKLGLCTLYERRSD